MAKRPTASDAPAETKKTAQPQTKDRLLPKITLSLFNKPKSVFLIWLVIVVFGVVSYATLLKREGFPSVNVPLAFINGTYIVNDAAKVDRDIARPISDLALKQDNSSLIQSQSAGNFFNVAIQYKEGVDAQKSTDELKRKVEQELKLPPNANIQYNVPYFGVTGGDAKKIDATISFYAKDGGKSTAELTAQAKRAVDYLNERKPALVQEFFVQDPFKQATDPRSGKIVSVQQSFDRYGERQDGQNKFYDSVVIGVTSVKKADVIELDKQLNQSLGQLQSQADFKDYSAKISASYGPAITENISELQRVLIEGLIAVLVVGSIVIAARASVITVVSMVTVITAVLALLYIIGYTLNVITLFGLILGLSLIVDDTIIMVEAIDAARRKQKTAREAVGTAIRKVSRAMMAATLTAALSFAPLLFVGGILGSFIRAIPVTIISALLISLVVALVFIPLFARVLLLGKKQMGADGVKEIAAGFENKIADALTWPMRWARTSHKKLLGVGMAAVLIGVGFIAAAGFVFSKVTFNLFPPTKDTNGVAVTLAFPPNTTIDKAEKIAKDADALTSSVLGGNLTHATYYGMANAQSAMMVAEIVSYNDRDVTSPQLVQQLQQKFDKEFTAAAATVAQVDVGPPASAFTVLVQTENREAGYKAANDIATYLKTAELTRVSGKKAHFRNVVVASPDQYARNDGKQSIKISANFDGDDTTTLVTLAQNDLKDKFGAKKMAEYGLSGNALAFDIGQESDNQQSFKALVIAFPLVLVAIYVLLLIEFRSFLQPLLIFLAIPFSLFGVTLGLFLTDNAFSFFVAMGFFALIGLSLKNTILLTDFANQSRRAGMGVIDSSIAALHERFRPLVATSLTAVVSLIPLAILSPFWQGLAVVLIFGLLSSTFLVVTVFPYYYLGGEFLRYHISRKMGLSWLVLTIVSIMLLMRFAEAGPLAILYAPVVVALALLLSRKVHRSYR